MSKILAFSGSTREGSFNRKLVTLGAEAVRAAGGEVTLLDLRDYRLPVYDTDLESQGVPENAQRLAELFSEHQGFLISSPEYNSGYSPLIKNTIDWITRVKPGSVNLTPFADKFAGLMAASPGGFGGLRGLLQLRTVLSYIKVHVLHHQVTISRAHEAFDEAGKLKNPSHQKGVEGVAAELVRILTKLNG